MIRAIHELEEVLNSAYEPLRTTGGDLEERIEQRYQVLLLKETSLREVDKNIEYFVDYKNARKRKG